MAVDVLLVTCSALRDGEPSHEVLDEALSRLRTLTR